MKTVITADIMHSRKVASAVWLTDLKTVLNNYGSEPRIRKFVAKETLRFSKCLKKKSMGICSICVKIYKHTDLADWGKFKL